MGFDDFFWADLDLRRLYTFRWRPTRGGTAFLALYRIIAGGYLFGISLWFWCCRGTPAGRYISFLTSVGLWVTIAYFMFGALAAVIATFQWAPAKYGSRAGTFLWRHLLRGTQVLADIAIPFEPLIVIGFWAAVYVKKEGESGVDLYQQIHDHGIACALLLGDAFLSCVRLPDRHSLITLFAGIVYMCWNIGYTVDNQPLYNSITWNNWTSAVAALVAFAVLMIVFFLESGLFYLRDKAFQACCMSPKFFPDDETDIFKDSEEARPCASCSRRRRAQRSMLSVGPQGASTASGPPVPVLDVPPQRNMQVDGIAGA